MRKYKPYDIWKNKKVNYAELSNEMKYEVSILGGLDIFTDAHVQGVTATTTKICEHMRMDYERLKHIVLGAYLHDVGKIMIPNEVLQKNGRLTEEEYEIIKTHTTYGYDICMRYPELKPYAPVARWHHESFDGSGYPDKLSSSQIPFETAVVKVADVYDALTRKRQYKEGFHKSEAIAIMLGDTKKRKMSAKILVHLIGTILDELYEEVLITLKNIEEFKEQLETLQEIGAIYSQIYKEGYTPKLEKKLKRYDLAPNYDMSTNANLLTLKQKALEKEEEKLIFLQEEENKLQQQYEETRQLAKEENYYPKEVYYK